jgi:hypothetical protein
MNKSALMSILPVLALLTLRSLADSALPEPGPENGGLRLSLVVTPSSSHGKEGYEVRLALRNISRQDITLQAAWSHETDKGDLKDYIEESTSIETYPAIAPWVGQVVLGHRASPQPEYVLKTDEVLSGSWRAEGRRLKNKVTDPNNVQNPEFPFSGLYSVHALLKIKAGRHLVLLRSNEQLVAIGGSRESPKFTYGQLWSVEADSKTATLSLGSLHKIKPGDQFEIRTGMSEFWKLSVSEVLLEISNGRLEPLLRIGPNAMSPNPRFPDRYMSATLIQNK